MRYLTKFNESDSFKNDDYDIRDFFTDYTDEDPNALSIENYLLFGNKLVKKTSYMKDVSKYRRCKVVKLKVGKTDGISTINGQCLTSFEMLKNAVDDIIRFYALSKEEVNYTINTVYDQLIITFITLGDKIKPEESFTEQIDKYLSNLKEILRGKGFRYRRISIKGNWLDLHTPIKGNDKSVYLRSIMKSIIIGDLNLNNIQSDRNIPLIKWRDKVINDGFNIKLGGGDNQVVVQLFR